MKNNHWTWWNTSGVIAIAIAIALISVLPVPLIKGNRGSTLLTWWIIMLLLVAFVLILGAGINGRWQGILIDQRNKMSLSRLQVLLWTILILSAWITAALWNILQSVPDPLGINVPGEVWALLGISAASFVSQPLILSVKEDRSPGRVDTNTVEQEAELDDMFRGDDESNADFVDLSKIQMFFFTIILVLAYGAALSLMLLSPEKFAPGAVVPPQVPLGGIANFPLLSAGMITLLAISHAGYLAYKAAPHPGPTSDAGPTIQVSPYSGPVGTVFSITSTGFTPNEATTVTLTQPGGTVVPRLAALGPNEVGVITDAVDSKGFAPGQWTWKAVGARSNQVSTAVLQVS